MKDLHVPEEKVGKVSVHVEICQSIVDLGFENQPVTKPQRDRNVNRWVDGKAVLAKAAQEPLPWPELEERLKGGKGGRELPQAWIPRPSRWHPSHLQQGLY